MKSHGEITKNENDKLISLAVYLSLIKNCTVTCVEDGNHFRPSVHSELSQKIHDKLFYLTTSDNYYILRKIYPSLPSYDDAFLNPDPLSLIREIAHRNDIPNELKNTIKHELQNKTHRCIGPEDIQTSERILGEIMSSQHNLSDDFIQQFERFHRELKDYLNALTIEERLIKIRSSLNIEAQDKINLFLEEKYNLTECYDSYLKLLYTLSDLRHVLKKESNTQNLILTDIGLENYLFVLLSKLSSIVDEADISSLWDLKFRSLSLAIKNIRFSLFEEKECLSIESELIRWSEKFDYQNKMYLHRLRATLLRCQELTAIYSDVIQI